MTLTLQRISKCHGVRTLSRQEQRLLIAGAYSLPICWEGGGRLAGIPCDGSHTQAAYSPALGSQDFYISNFPFWSCNKRSHCNPIVASRETRLATMRSQNCPCRSFESLACRNEHQNEHQPTPRHSSRARFLSTRVQR